MAKELLFRLTKNDFEVRTFRVGGHGGQNVDKTETGVEIRHPASGAHAQCVDERSLVQNKKKAFERLVQTEAFKKWHRIECARRLGLIGDIEKEVDQEMKPKNLRVEGYDPEKKKWVECNDTKNSV